MTTNDTANKPRVLTEVESKDMLGKAGWACGDVVEG